MTEVAFHFNIAKRSDYACRLVRKAWLAEAKLIVAAPEDDLRELDVQLWTFEAQGFLPHCLWQAPAHVLAASPIVLAPESALDALPHHQVLVHWGGHSEPPPGFQRFARLIELVSTEPHDREQARGRWKYFSERGYTMTRFDVKSRNH